MQFKTHFKYDRYEGICESQNYLHFTIGLPLGENNPRNVSHKLQADTVGISCLYHSQAECTEIDSDQVVCGSVINYIIKSNSYIT